VSQIFILLLSVVAWLSLSGRSGAQLPLSVADVVKITPVFNTPSDDSLKCSIDQRRPRLDFAFRFTAGYTVHCRLGVFEGRKVNLIIYARVTPEGKPPSLLGEAYHLREVTREELHGMNPRKLKPEIGMSGAFSVGEGDYLVEVLAMDDRGRTCRKHWPMHVAADRSQRDVPLTIVPLKVESLDTRGWDIAPVRKAAGVRVTVLLDAAPINPYEPTLRAWDRAFLLQSLYSLLRETPFKSVRVVAFNLEQQRELFRKDSFDREGFVELAHSLRNMETATVSVQALKKRDSPEFLAALADKELAAAGPSDAVIFLGPNSRPAGKTPAKMIPEKTAGATQFFYFQYFPWAGAVFPDAIERLTKALNGKVFTIHSPAELEQAIHRMLAQLKQE